MAKLSAHGEEVIRIKREHQVEPEHDSGDGTTYHYVLAFMADGTVLEKIGSTYVSEFTGKTTHYPGTFKRAVFHGKPATYHKVLALGMAEARRVILRNYGALGWTKA